MLIATGCAGGFAGGDVESGTYVATHDNAAQMLQVTVDDRSVSGTMDIATLSNDRVDRQHLSITGTISDDHVTVSINEGLGIVRNITGVVEGGALVLNIPQTDGSVAKVAFRRGSVETYNQAVAGLQAVVDDQLDAEAAAAQQQALDSKVSAAARRVREDVEGLGEASFGSTGLKEDLQVVKDDIELMKEDQAMTRAEPDADARCADAQAVVADAEAVEADYEVVLANLESIKSTASEFRHDIDHARANLRALNRAMAANPDHAGPVPSANEVERAIARVERLISKTLAQAKTVVAEAKALSASAMQVANAFEKQYCG